MRGRLLAFGSLERKSIQKNWISAIICVKFDILSREPLGRCAARSVHLILRDWLGLIYNWKLEVEYERYQLIFPVTDFHQLSREYFAHKKSKKTLHHLLLALFSPWTIIDHNLVLRANNTLYHHVYRRSLYLVGHKILQEAHLTLESLM